MAQVESKSNVFIEIEVKGRNGDKKGHLSLTSGNVYYYRKNAKMETERLTYQQLVDLIEDNLEENGEN